MVRVSAVGLNPTDWKHVGNAMSLSLVGFERFVFLELRVLGFWGFGVLGFRVWGFRVLEFWGLGFRVGTRFVRVKGYTSISCGWAWH